MTPEESFLVQMTKVTTSTVTFGERLNNLVYLLAQYLKVDLALYFGLDKSKEILFLNLTSKGPKPSNLQVEFPLGQGLVGEVAESGKVKTVYRSQPYVLTSNQALAKLHPEFMTLAGFPVADGNFRYGVLILVDRHARNFNAEERNNVQLAALNMAGILRQAFLQEEAQKRIAELSVLFEVGKGISSTLELDYLLDRVVAITAKVMTAGGAALQIIDTTTEEVCLSSQYGQIPLPCPFPAEIQAPECHEELSYLQGHQINGEGLTHYFLALPLTFKDLLQGTICVYDKIGPNGEYLAFDPENRKLLHTMAGLIVNGIENALAFQQVGLIAEENERMVEELRNLGDIEPYILRSIEFSPEHHETGMTILNYFGTVLRQKYPGMKVKVKIEQEELIVRMVIQTEEGNIEKLEKTLEDYGLVVLGQKTPEEFLSNPFEILQLKNQLKIAHLQLENQKEIIGIQNSLHGHRISELEDEIRWLRSHVASILIHSQDNIKAIKEVMIGAHKLLEGRDDIIESAISLISKKLQEGIIQSDIAEIKQTLEAIRDRNPSFFEKFIDKINLLIIQGSISGVAGNLLYDLIKSLSRMC